MAKTVTPAELRDRAKALKEAGEEEYARQYEQKAQELEEGGTHKNMADEIIIPVSQEDWEKTGSKFPALGTHPIEVTECGWETPGKSIKFVIEITGGPDEGKTDKIVGGATPGNTWKTREILDNLDVAYKFGKSGLAFKPSDVEGHKGVGVWTEQVGKKGGVGEEVRYPKLTAILQEGAEVEG